MVEHLSADIDARQPAPITRVTVVPANGILQTADLREIRHGTDVGDGDNKIHLRIFYTAELQD